MIKEQAMELILAELVRSRTKHPPFDPMTLSTQEQSS